MRRVLVAAAVAVLTGLLASPAAAKFWAFEVTVDRTRITAGEPLTVRVQVAPDFADDADALPTLQPPVDLYRLDDLPEDGYITSNVPVAAPLDFERRPGGAYLGTVTPPGPGRYALVSMGVWNEQVEGYPAPVMITVDPARERDSRGASRGLASAASAVGLVGIGSLVALGLCRRRRPPG